MKKLGSWSRFDLLVLLDGGRPRSVDELACLVKAAHLEVDLGPGIALSEFVSAGIGEKLIESQDGRLALSTLGRRIVEELRPYHTGS